MEFTLAFCLFCPGLAAQVGGLLAEEPLPSGYVLGVDDQIIIRALNAPEISDKPIEITGNGDITLPLAGRIHAAGLTVEELEVQIARRLETYLEEPQVAVSITQWRSQPVSVMGAVTNPGTYQLRGAKTLLEALSLAGGPRYDAGHTIRIVRRSQWGRIPLPTANEDASGIVSVAEVNLESVMRSKDAQENIVLQPNDVISVPRADIVYVLGEVGKPGGFALNEREGISLLQALSLAGGIGRTAAPQNARLLRGSGKVANRSEVRINVKQVLAGKQPDVMLHAEDVLFIPNNTAKAASLRAVEAAIQLGTGVIIWRR